MHHGIFGVFEMKTIIWCWWETVVLGAQKYSIEIFSRYFFARPAETVFLHEWVSMDDTRMTKRQQQQQQNNRYWLLPSMYQIAIPPASIDASNADTFLNYDMALCWHSMGWWWMWYAAWSSVVDGDKTGWWAATHTLGCTYSIYYRKKILRTHVVRCVIEIGNACVECRAQTMYRVKCEMYNCIHMIYRIGQKKTYVCEMPIAINEISILISISGHYVSLTE